jgi:hypothetical protein
MKTVTVPRREFRLPPRKRSREEMKYLQLWKEACAAQGWKAHDRELRMRIHTRLFGSPISSTVFRHHHFDRTIKLFKLLANSVDLDSAIEVVGYENHDSAQADHQPIIRPGRTFPHRDHPSKYEAETSVDDPGERRRCVYVIGRLFRPDDIDDIKRDLFATARPWDELDIPDLIQLRDTLKSRLGAWLTAAKKEPFPNKLIGIEIAGGKGPSGYISNKEIISRLLKIGKPVNITNRKHLAERREAIMEPGLFDKGDPF